MKPIAIAIVFNLDDDLQFLCMGDTFEISILLQWFDSWRLAFDMIFRK